MKTTGIIGITFKDGVPEDIVKRTIERIYTENKDVIEGMSYHEFNDENTLSEVLSYVNGSQWKDGQKKDEPAPAHMSEVPNKDTEDIGAPLEPAQDTTDIGPVPAVPEAPQACAPTENSLLDLIQKYVGNDVLQVFGDTGAGKKVYYLDTERNLTDADVAHLKGCDYHYTLVLDEIDKIVQNLPVGVAMNDNSIDEIAGDVHRVTETVDNYDPENPVKYVVLRC